MADTTWLTTLSPQFISGVAPADVASVTASLASLITRLAGATDAQGAQLRNSFISSAMGEGLSVVGVLDPTVLGPVTAGIQSVQAVLNAPLVVLADLEAAAEPLRLAARAAWQVAATAGQTARTLERLERAAAAAASSGLPGVVGLWAVARQLDAAALDIAEASARGASAADQAWASAQHVVDDIRRQALVPIAAVNKVLNDTVRLMTNAPGSAGSNAAFLSLHGDLVGVFHAVIP